MPAAPASMPRWRNRDEGRESRGASFKSRAASPKLRVSIRESHVSGLKSRVSSPKLRVAGRGSRGAQRLMSPTGFAQVGAAYAVTNASRGLVRLRWSVRTTLPSLPSKLPRPTKVRDPGHDGAWPSRKPDKTWVCLWRDALRRVLFDFCRCHQTLKNETPVFQIWKTGGRQRPPAGPHHVAQARKLAAEAVISSSWCPRRRPP
jgi:hypothetical protein